ncbi:uncharacterized protein GGS22DRAFT_111288 [Annulohypoxylon maeteangense]|uniref:uncharacterized protein n=1 Tax=Annulohypoxylon maeteangense TaxID=1927788 RepID=UPI002008C398|nr:uncharacterized protein GGS22DRAFT_111288 [Annulohypoxylon maeteangense]KAI0887562.1 hypothetical protein GGS22DRAFT_111288 [Annulohypoxylon maeteangense]
MEKMDAHNGPREGSLATAPAELIQAIGRNFNTQRQLLEFACTCKSAYPAVGLYQMVQMDVKRQRTEIPQKLPSWRPSWRPAVLWAIESGKDINYIMYCIELYQDMSINAIHGMWYPKIRNGSSYFPSPAYMALKEGRVDLFEALLRRGANLTPGNIDNRTDAVGRNPQHIAGEISLRKSQYTLFRGACESGREDIARLLISKGVPRNFWDLWLAAKAGFFDIVNQFLTDTPQAVIEGTVFHIISRHKSFENLDIIMSLLGAIPNREERATYVEWLIHSMISTPTSHSQEQVPYTTNTNDLAARTIYLLKIYVKLVRDRPIDSAILAKAAVETREDRVEVLKYLLSGGAWRIGFGRWDRLDRKKDLMDIAAGAGSTEQVRFLARLSGVNYTLDHLTSAINLNNTEIMIDAIDSGVPANSICTVESMVLNKYDEYEYSVKHMPLLEYALVTRRFKNLLPLCCLLYYGADYSKVSNAKHTLWPYLWYSGDCYQYLSHRNQSDIYVPPRPLELAHIKTKGKYDYQEGPEYYELVHTVASLLLGEDYWTELQKRGADFERRQQEREDHERTIQSSQGDPDSLDAESSL